MNYEMEELLPIVSRLAEKYTGNESTSISYEKAQQLMEAVLYCIRVAEEGKSDAVSALQRVSARQMYEAGLAAVEQKVKETLTLYNRILPEFCSYEIRCLEDTFFKGLPEFFRWYDIRFAPQETILTLDYPVLRDLPACRGIQKIQAYLECICLEQDFLRTFPEEYVQRVLFLYDPEYRDSLDNICEVLLMALAGHVLAEKPFTEPELTEADYKRIQSRSADMELPELNRYLIKAVQALVDECWGENTRLFEYLSQAVEHIAVRLKNISF